MVNDIIKYNIAVRHILLSLKHKNEGDLINVTQINIYWSMYRSSQWPFRSPRIEM